MKNIFPVFWLTGNSGAGKTTLATGMQQHFNEAVPAVHPLARKVVVLDGDEMRATISTEETLTAEDRRKHNLRVARLAKLLQSQGFLVLVSVIAPFERVRTEIDGICSPLWVYVKRSGLGAADRPYEVPQEPDVVVDNDVLGIEEGQILLAEFLEARSPRVIGVKLTQTRQRSA